MAILNLIKVAVMTEPQASHPFSASSIHPTFPASSFLGVSVSERSRGC